MDSSEDLQMFMGMLSTKCLHNRINQKVDTKSGFVVMRDDMKLFIQPHPMVKYLTDRNSVSFFNFALLR